MCELIVAIDPGAQGGIVYDYGNAVHAVKMMKDPGEIYAFLKGLVLIIDGYESVVCYVEKVGGYMPGNSGPAAVKFARHCGHIEAFLLALKIKTHYIAPVVWMNYFVGKIGYPGGMPGCKRKTLRKNIIKAKAQELYPDVKITLAIADALGILSYGCMKENYIW